MNWLLLRGLSREQRHWGDFLATFEQANPGARAHCLDLPGTGTEHARPSPMTIDAIAADVRARWIALCDAHPGPWGILAISLGGMVAMAWCAAHPDDFARAVIASSSAGDLSPFYRRFHPRILPGALRAITARDPVARERHVLSITTRAVRDPDAVAAAWARYQADRPVAAAAVLRQLRAASVFRAPARLAVPALVLAGGRDPMVDPSCSRAIASRFGAPLEVHPDAGHELALDAPEWVAERVAAWVRGSQPAPSR